MNVQTQLRILAALDAAGGVLTPETALPFGISRALLTKAHREAILDRPRRGMYVRPGLEIGATLIDGLQLGDEAALSHRGAANDYRWDGIQRGVVEWSIPHQRKATLPGVYLRRRFDELEILPRPGGGYITSPAQTLADLGSAPGIDIDILERAMESALRLGDVDERTLRAFAALPSHRPGAPMLRAALARRPLGAPPTESDGETLYLQAIRPAAIEDPYRQFELRDDDGTFVARVDFHWWPIRFGVEVLGFESHSSPDALQWDANRSNRVSDRKHIIRYFTYRDVSRRQVHVARETLRGLAVAQELFTNGSRNRRKAG